MYEAESDRYWAKSSIFYFLLLMKEAEAGRTAPLSYKPYLMLGSPSLFDIAVQNPEPLCSDTVSMRNVRDLPAPDRR